jgi:radical SAM superfamily enzyme YgiQ (UPF0313 family)
VKSPVLVRLTPELLELMGKVGFKSVFLGIETSNPSSLEECHKLQNTHRDMAASIPTIQHAGMEVMGGFIVGFDNGPPDVFLINSLTSFSGPAS